LRRPLPPCEPFPVNALGGALGAAATAICDKIQCAPAVAAASVLACASLASQAVADVVHPATGRASPLSLYLITVAESGDRKSAADFEAMWPARNHEEALAETYAREIVNYNRAKRAFDQSIATAEKTKGSRDAIEAALEAVGDEPTAPLKPHIIMSEPTWEGVVKAFDLGQPSLGLFSAEGGAFLGGHGFTQETRLRTMTGLSLAWDGEPIRRTRGGEGASILRGRRLASHLMLQGVVASSLFSDPLALGQGFLSRVLVSAPQSLVGTRLQKPVSPNTEPALRRYGACILSILENPAPPLPGCSRNTLDPRKLQLAPAAETAWRGIVDAVEVKMKDGGEYEQIRGFAGKLGEHILRIAGVLAIVDDAVAVGIEAEALLRAAAIGDFFASEACRLFEAGCMNPDIALAEKTLNWLLNGWNESLVN
jgi:Protein of unknown function (DUF3987)